MVRPFLPEIDKTNKQKKTLQREIKRDLPLVESSVHAMHSGLWWLIHERSTWGMHSLWKWDENQIWNKTHTRAPKLNVTLSCCHLSQRQSKHSWKLDFYMFWRKYAWCLPVRNLLGCCYAVSKVFCVFLTCCYGVLGGSSQKIQKIITFWSIIKLSNECHYKHFIIRDNTTHTYATFKV